MNTVALIVVVALLVALTAWVRRRRSDREISSIDHYRHALDTLREMQHDGPPQGLRVLQDGDEVRTVRPLASPPKLEPPETSGWVARRDEGDAVYVFDETRPRSGERPVEEDERRQSDWAINHLGGGHHHHRTPRWRVLAAVVAVAVLLALAYAWWSSGGSAAPPVSTTTTTTSSSTTTSVPSSFAPTTQGIGTASYLTPTSNYVLGISAGSGPCWVEIHNRAGTVLYGQVVAAGALDRFALSQPATVSLGSPSGTAMTLSGVPLRYPRQLASPLVLSFEPASANPGG